jgi:hypothetical protein
MTVYRLQAERAQYGARVAQRNWQSQHGR